MLSNLKKYQTDYVFFSVLRKPKVFSSALLNIKNPFVRDFAYNNEKHYLMQVPESLESFLSMKDKQSRSKYKRQMKKVEKEYKDRHEFKIFINEEDVDQFYKDAEIVAQKSQLRSLNIGFKPTKSNLNKKKWLARNGFFRSYILYLDNIPVCFMEGMNYKRHYSGENTGYNMEFDKLRLGTYLKLKMIEDISQTKCSDFLDFGLGSDQWKQSLSTNQYEEIRVKTYLPKFSNIFFIMTITVFEYLNRWTRVLLKKTMFYKSARKFLRSLFAKKILDKTEYNKVKINSRKLT